MRSRRDEILDVAVAVVEEEGPEALTMRELADRMGIRAPSLYKHVRDKDDIVAGVQERALLDLGRHLSAVTGQGLIALAEAYRSWARAHPRLYEVATRRPLARDEHRAGRGVRRGRTTRDRCRGGRAPRPRPVGARPRAGRPRALGPVPAGG